MFKRIGIAAVALAALGLLAGCAPAVVMQSAPGLGGSDGGAGELVGIGGPDARATSPAVAENLGIVPWATPHGFRITFDTSKLPAGTTASLAVKDFNCMAEALSGSIDLSQPKQFLVELDQGTTCWFGTRDTSWITWTLTLGLPGGATKSTTFELAFHHKGGEKTETKCWGDGGVTCTQAPVGDWVHEGDWNVEYFTQTLQLT